MGFLLALAAVAGLWWAIERGGYPSGHGPFDALPAGLGTRTGPTAVTAPTSGLAYHTYTYPTAQPTVTFNVAELASKQGWVSFWSDATTGARTMVSSYVATIGTPPPPALTILQKDFGLS